MPHRQRERGIGALFGVEPQIGELGRFGIIRADHCHFGATVARLSHEMGVGCARLRHIRSPHHQEPGIVPVCAFGNVGLFAPGHRAGGR